MVFVSVFVFLGGEPSVFLSPMCSFPSTLLVVHTPSHTHTHTHVYLQHAYSGYTQSGIDDSQKATATQQ